jgi:hypothetical protein
LARAAELRNPLQNELSFFKPFFDPVTPSQTQSLSRHLKQSLRRCRAQMILRLHAPSQRPPSFAQPRSQSRETDRGKRVREGQNHLELHGNMNCKNASQDLIQKLSSRTKAFLSLLWYETQQKHAPRANPNHLDTTAMYRLRENSFCWTKYPRKKQSRGRSVTGFLHSDGCREDQNSTCSVCESGDGDKTGTRSAEVDDAQKQRKRSSRSSVAMAGDFCVSIHTGFPFFSIHTVFLPTWENWPLDRPRGQLWEGLH